MIGLALMVRDLAEKRHSGCKLNTGEPERIPVSRMDAQSPWNITSREYYAIIDRLNRGERP